MRETRRKKPVVQQNAIDRVVSYFNPVRGQERLRARASMALVGGYLGGKKSRKPLSSWYTRSADADTDILPDLETLRERSRDAVRNSPLATAAINTKVTNIIGTGLKLRSVIDRDYLKLSDEKAEELQNNIEREWRLFTKYCDLERQSSFVELQSLIFRAVLESGDLLVSTPRVKRPETPYNTKLQLIEADRVCNKDGAPDKPGLSGGVERARSGAPIRYHILKSHPGNIHSGAREWSTLDAFGSDGMRRVLHPHNKLRPGQSRGVPDLAPVIEAIKQLSDYTEQEIHAAVVSGLFTVFVETEGGDSLGGTVEEGADGEQEIKLGSGSIVGLAQGEKITSVNPGRPNTAFDGFIVSVTRVVGAAIELPHELLLKHFTSSYSAARAALLEAWKFFDSRRKWFAEQLCQPIFEIFMVEAVGLGRIKAPGFLKGDPAVRMAYCKAEWIGPARGHIQPLQEAKAEVELINNNVKTLSRVIAETTGEDFDAVHKQRAREVRLQREDQIIPEKLQSLELDELPKKSETNDDETD
ncbi:MAG: phage portal protein [Gammaproteobacteria bacterium]|nr:phage portal protein [Gammaproteobacteria bacterium]